MRGLKIGHYTDHEKGTGLSVFLFDQAATGAYCIAGAAPASHEFAVFDPEMSVTNIHGLLLTGGSAYGLFAAKGVVRWLTEKNIGYPTPHGVVPIVPAAAIYDLLTKTSHPPTEENAYEACRIAVENNKASGAIGAGTGATVGKLIPDAQPMASGLGYAEINLPDGLEVAAYAVVNCVGDVRDVQGKIIAGAKYPDGKFADCQEYLLSGQIEKQLFQRKNTTLVAVFTNAVFSKSDLKRLAKMAIAGMGRAISPVFTQYDGDTIFCVSIGDRKASELMVGAMAAEVARKAIVQGAVALRNVD